MKEAARLAAAELEALDIQQVEESERQPWTPAYRDRVVSIIDRYMKGGRHEH